jgi:hypothetical protein
MLQTRRGSSATAFGKTDTLVLGHEGICFGTILAVHRLIVHSVTQMIRRIGVRGEELGATATKEDWCTNLA